MTAALAVHALSRRGDPGYLPELSRRQGRHVYRHGFSPRKRFAFTVGNTITNARDIEDESRRQLIERHEGLHVWQQRWFGPLFPLVYGLWMVGGAVTGSVVWMFHRDRKRGRSSSNGTRTTTTRSSTGPTPPTAWPPAR